MIKMILIFIFGMLTVAGIWNIWSVLEFQHKVIVFKYFIRFMIFAVITAIISAGIVFLF